MAVQHSMVAQPNKTACMHRVCWQEILKVCMHLLFVWQMPCLSGHETHTKDAAVEDNYKQPYEQALHGTSAC